MQDTHLPDLVYVEEPNDWTHQASRAKYGLLQDMEIETEITGHFHETAYFRIHNSGRLLAKQGYVWDGPSGPTWDCPESLVGSLFHDILYQSMRAGVVPQEERLPTDLLFHKLLRVYDFPRFRAWLYYRAVRWRGGTHAAKVDLTVAQEKKIVKGPECPEFCVRSVLV